MDEQTAELAREFTRVAMMGDFVPDDRIWWIYMRNAAGRWLESHEDASVRVAFDRLKAFPENLGNERLHWHALRDAVSEALDRAG